MEYLSPFTLSVEAEMLTDDTGFGKKNNINATLQFDLDSLKRCVNGGSAHDPPGMGAACYLTEINHIYWYSVNEMNLSLFFVPIEHFSTFREKLKLSPEKEK